jgi:hypothetical protein
MIPNFFLFIIKLQNLKYIKKYILWENKTEGVINMEMNTRDTIMKKLLDAQENTRDYQSFAREVSEEEVSNTFKEFAVQSAMQAQKLQQLLSVHDAK